MAWYIWYDVIWWYDMMWCDVMWCDMIYDVIWCDMVWYDVMWCDMIWYDMIWCDVICYDMIYDMIWYDVIWYDVMWYDMMWYDVMWYDMMWYDMMWYDVIQVRPSHTMWARRQTRTNKFSCKLIQVWLKAKYGSVDYNLSYYYLQAEQGMMHSRNFPCPCLSMTMTQTLPVWSMTMTGSCYCSPRVHSYQSKCYCILPFRNWSSLKNLSNKLLCTVYSCAQRAVHKMPPHCAIVV